MQVAAIPPHDPIEQDMEPQAAQLYPPTQLVMQLFPEGNVPVVGHVPAARCDATVNQPEARLAAEHGGGVRGGHVASAPFTHDSARDPDATV
jgi:hypothetical protein